MCPDTHDTQLYMNTLSHAETYECASLRTPHATTYARTGESLHARSTDIGYMSTENTGGWTDTAIVGEFRHTGEEHGVVSTLVREGAKWSAT